jgi:hypothetical protein
MLVNSPRTARRLLNRNVLGCASALLFLLASGCKSSDSPADLAKNPSTANAAAAHSKNDAPAAPSKVESAPSIAPELESLPRSRMR